MKHRSWLVVACAGVLSTGCASTMQESGSSASTNFNGDWQLVTGRSDEGGGWLDARNSLGVEDRDATLRSGRRVRYRAWFLPDEFHIEGSRSRIRIEDRGGTLIAEVPFEVDDPSGGYDERTNNRALEARWIDDRTFQVQRIGPYRRLRQTFSLEDRSRRLRVETEVERDGGTRSYTRVYDRG